jgi:hypothetical protein
MVGAHSDPREASESRRTEASASIHQWLNRGERRVARHRAARGREPTPAALGLQQGQPGNRKRACVRTKRGSLVAAPRRREAAWLAISAFGRGAKGARRGTDGAAPAPGFGTTNAGQRSPEGAIGRLPASTAHGRRSSRPSVLSRQESVSFTRADSSPVRLPPGPAFESAVSPWAPQ